MMRKIISNILAINYGTTGNKKIVKSASALLYTEATVTSFEMVLIMRFSPESGIGVQT